MKVCSTQMLNNRGSTFPRPTILVPMKLLHQFGCQCIQTELQTTASNPSLCRVPGNHLHALLPKMIRSRIRNGCKAMPHTKPSEQINKKDLQSKLVWNCNLLAQVDLKAEQLLTTWSQQKLERMQAEAIYSYNKKYKQGPTTNLHWKNLFERAWHLVVGFVRLCAAKALRIDFLIHSSS